MPPATLVSSPPAHAPNTLQVGPHICVFKTHVDVFDTWSDEYAARLRQLADKHGAGCHRACGAAMTGGPHG